MINSLVVILSLILLLSVAINVFFVWYLIGLTRTIMFFSENLNDLLDLIKDFASHTKSIYELETFYGDETLHGLMQHSRDLVQQLEKFDEIIYLAEEEPKEDDMDEQEDEPEPDASTPESEDQEKKIPSQIRFQI